MTDRDGGFQSIWASAQRRAQPNSTPRPRQCLYAVKFTQWAGELCANVTKNPNIIAINQAKLMLTEKYFEWRNSVPGDHRDRPDTKHHSCIYQVFMDAFGHLQAVQLAISPPAMLLPPSSAALPVGGTIIGLSDDGDDSSTK